MDNTPYSRRYEDAGFLNFIKRDRDKLAIVLGHEVSHVLARHGVERMGMSLLLMAGATLLVAWIRYSRAVARAQRYAACCFSSSAT